MKRLLSIATAGFGLVLTAVAPNFAKADTHRNDHRDVRVERHDYRGNDRFDRHDRFDHDRFDRGGFSVGVRVPVYVDRPVYVEPAPVYVDRDCDQSVFISDVPSRVLETVRCEASGPIDSIRFVRSGGLEFYRLVVHTRGGDLAYRVDCGGRMLSVEHC
jgi:hypothetical protein